MRILVESCQEHREKTVKNAGQELSRMLRESCQQYWLKARSKVVENAGRELSRTLVRSWSEAVKNAD